MNTAPGEQTGGSGGYTPDRAVIDIGSNTVRLVVYAGPLRAPRTWLNESVAARLGRDLSVTGRMPDKATRQALGALKRYAAIVGDLGIGDLQTVATAAVRDAANGGEFLEEVRALGLAPRLLTGEEEAQGSAFGVIGAFPGARGTVADLGGGSLELVQVKNGACHDGVSLPLGTLRLPALQAAGPGDFDEAIAREMRKARASMAHSGPLYMVGGTWRAFAAFAIKSEGVPLSDPHGFALETVSAQRIARDVARISPEELAKVPGISASRASGLPDAAAMLRILLEELAPRGLLFSSWGLREGLLFQRLGPGTRAQDPLLAGIDDFAGPRGGSSAAALRIATWIAPAMGEATPALERLRIAAAQLALAAAHVEANLRTRQACEWAMDKRWIGLEPPERAWIGAAVQAAGGVKGEYLPDLTRLAAPVALESALGWGLAVRLARRFDPASSAGLAASTLARDPSRLLLGVDPVREHQVTPKVLSDLKNLAKWMNLKPELVVSPSASR